MALAKPPPAGFRIQRDADAEAFCKLLGLEADCFKYEGGWISCWVETDVSGKKSNWGEVLGENMRIAGKGALLGEPAEGEPSGVVVWVRRSVDKKEVWDLAFTYKLQNGNGDTRVTLGPPHGPPQPSVSRQQRLVRGDAETSLKDGKEVTLVTLLSLGEKDDITRTVKLKCKALK